MMTTTITSTTTWRRQRQHDDDCGGVNVSENNWKESHFSRRRRHGEAHLLDDCRFIINFRVTKTITTTKTTTAARQFFLLRFISRVSYRWPQQTRSLQNPSETSEWRSWKCWAFCSGQSTVRVLKAYMPVSVLRPRQHCVICKTYLSSSPQVSRLGFEPRTSTVNLCPIS